MSSLSRDIKKSKGWKRFPIVDVLAGLVVAAAAVALEKVYGGNALLAIAMLLAVGGFIVALPFDYAGYKRWSQKPRDEAIEGIVYGVRIFIVIAIFSIVSSLLLNFI